MPWGEDFREDGLWLTMSGLGPDRIRLGIDATSSGSLRRPESASAADRESRRSRQNRAYQHHSLQKSLVQLLREEELVASFYLPASARRGSLCFGRHGDGDRQTADPSIAAKIAGELAAAAERWALLAPRPRAVI